MILKNRNVHLYVETEIEDSEFYCYNTKEDRSSVVSQASCKMDVSRLEQRAYIKIAVLRGRNARPTSCQFSTEGHCSPRLPQAR